MQQFIPVIFMVMSAMPVLCQLQDILTTTSANRVLKGSAPSNRLERKLLGRRLSFKGAMARETELPSDVEAVLLLILLQ
jgi:hypothetical protein